MKKIDFYDIRNIQFEILQFFHDFCVKNNITYYLSNGTLLGAVKYKGYIPWDDDIDVCMPRQDYERLIKIWRQSENCKYRLCSLELEDNYCFPFAKLSDETTVLIEGNIGNGCQLGVNIDIFPLDGFGNSEEEILKIYSKMESIRRKLNLSKLRPKPNDNIIKKVLKNIVAFKYKCIGSKKICLQIDSFAKKLNINDCQYIGNVVWGFYAPGEAHKKELFEEKITVIFEGLEFYAPKGYDAFLRRLYGDYEKDPLPEQQVTHHVYTAFYK